MTALTITEAARRLRSGQATAVDLLRQVSDLADKLDPQLGVYITRFAGRAQEAAERADRELAAGLDRGPLHGIPLGVKDILATKGWATTGQSLVNDPSWWQDRDAPVVARLRAAGAVITGKTTTMEYAIGLPDPDKPFPVPRNPWDPVTWPGGSSSGTGAGVAAGLFLGGLGTDTGGSIRIPAAYCGITGHKPTYGLVPRAGCLPLGFSLDHIGPMARSAADCALMLDVMAGHDSLDPAAQPDVPGGYAAALTGDLTGLRIGVERTIPLSAPDRDGAVIPALNDTAAALAAAGAELVDVTIPVYRDLADADTIIMASEAFSYHRDMMRERWADYGRYTRAFIAQGALLSAADYVTAQRARRVACAALDDVLATVDVILTPTAATAAPAYEDIDLHTLMAVIFTGAFNSTGLPVLAAPAGFTTSGMPLSVQVIGHPLADATVLAVGDALQRRTAHHLAEPEIATHD
ncbi:MAG TPA: amidase [Trebonia sp.]|jgi:aspartyl-tRNA(Asn)/glutamyl-tRNA(Gln) amidotransferase subunit A|nr:amidase [Trebonia sp.]